MIDLSILIPTIPSRVNGYFPQLVEKLNQQIGNLPIEVIGLYDNKKQLVGQKRNHLLNLASGLFLTFVDDDDQITDDYIYEIYSTIEENRNADCIVYQVLCSINGSIPYLCKYGVELEYKQIPGLWTGKPAHTMVWKSELAKTCKFPTSNFGEDSEWVAQAWPQIKKQVNIDKVLYHYQFNNQTTQTREDQVGNIYVK